MSAIRDHLLYVRERYAGVPEMLKELDRLEAERDAAVTLQGSMSLETFKRIEALEAERDEARRAGWEQIQRFHEMEARALAAEASVDELRRALELIVNQPPNEILVPAGWTIAEANAARMLDIAREALVRVGLPAEEVSEPLAKESRSASGGSLTSPVGLQAEPPEPGDDRSAVVNRPDWPSWVRERLDKPVGLPNTDRQQPGQAEAGHDRRERS